MPPRDEAQPERRVVRITSQGEAYVEEVFVDGKLVGRSPAKFSGVVGSRPDFVVVDDIGEVGEEVWEYFSAKFLGE